MTRLPIEAILPSLQEALGSHKSAVLIAEPGAGKTTRVPLALLDEPWMRGRKILMLEPRRLAARSAAAYMAALLGEQAGETVGYRVRLDSKVGSRTRIEVITEGVLTRMLQADPALEDVGLVIFDEFHERSLHADLGLALCAQSREVLREDLRILVMSATLNGESVAALLNHAPLLYSKGRAFPVETRYGVRPQEGRLEASVVRVIEQAIRQDEGDVLVFLPGAGEIRRVHSLLAGIVERDVLVAPLYGNLPQEKQDLAIAPTPDGRRKIVLATSIAETSLTVQGVRVVIDSGLSRIPRFSPRTGMTRLETVRVSLASADQRRGRAGRLAPGVCYRLWSETENRQLAPRSTPEILETDLAPLALELAAWGVSDPEELLWLDVPPSGSYRQACNLLTELGALNEEGAITPHGRQLAELGLHPRLSHMILKALPLQLGGAACELAAILGERDFLRGTPGADLRLRMEALHKHVPSHSDYIIDEAAASKILAAANHWKRSLGISIELKSQADEAGLLLAFAYPERIGQLRGEGRFLLSNGRGAVMAKLGQLSQAPYLVAAELDDQGPDSRILLAAPLQSGQLEQHFRHRMEEESLIEWDRVSKAVKVRKTVRLGALVIREAVLPSPDPEQTLQALLAGIREEGLELLPWTRTARQLQHRLIFMHIHHENWSDRSDGGLLATLEEWLAPHVYGVKSRDGLQKLNLQGILEHTLSWEQRKELDEWAPTHAAVPSGSRIPIDYSDPHSPVLAVRLQELFGLPESPRIAGGRIPLLLHLLSPAQRPVQVTRDLSSFWKAAYFEVKKDLKGRYPKHYWPDDPLAAMPTNRAKPR